MRLIASLTALAAATFDATAIALGEGVTRSSEAIFFEIPAQPLATALEAYSIAAGREVVYNGKLVAGRQSGAVRGTLAPDAALRYLLAGSGLSARYMAEDAFVLLPTPQEKRRFPANTTSYAALMHYYGLIQSGLRQAFCVDGHTRPGAYRVAVSFWIGPSGKVSDVELLGTTGEPSLDGRIEGTIRAFAVDASPPDGFAQPVTLVVTPQASQGGRDCGLAKRPNPTSAALHDRE